MLGFCRSVPLLLEREGGKEGCIGTADSRHPSTRTAEGVWRWVEVGSSRRALEQTLSDSEQPFSPKRQINPPDCVGGVGVGSVSPGT